jgi:hypothetical protein
VEHNENLDLPPVTTHVHQPKYSQIKVTCFLTLKVKGKGFEYLFLLFYLIKINEGAAD